MKRLPAIFVSTLLFTLPLSGSAIAQGLAEQGIVGTVGVGALYGATRSVNKPRVDPVIDIVLRQQGYTNVSAVASSPSQYTAVAPNQGPVLLTLDPETNQILSVEPR